MGFNCGIVGLPNVGKSTIFNAMTGANAPAANYPFCTKDHHTGMVPLADQRLDNISAIFRPQRTIPTQIEFVDIAGLVEGASRGEGLGNKFLANIREVDAIAHVVRCFAAPDVVHQYEKVDPIHDIEIIDTELLLSDLESVSKRWDKIAREAKLGEKEAKLQFHAVDIAKLALEDGKPLRSIDFSEQDAAVIRSMELITAKPMLFVLNVGDDDIKNPSPIVKAALDYCAKIGAPAIEICGSIEGELSSLNESERREFLTDLGLKESGLDRLARAAYSLLNLITFFTKDGPEVRAWTIPAGTKAPQAAGKIHTDFEKGFIRAEVYPYDALMKHGTEQKLKELGLVRIEGAEYAICDGDIVHFRFNV